jgi:hypothetical protein
MSPSLAVSSPSLRCAAIVAILLSGVLPDILLKLAAATCSTSSSSSDPYSFSRSANFHPDFPPKSWTSLTCQATQKTIAGGKKTLSSYCLDEIVSINSPRHLELSVCLSVSQAISVRQAPMRGSLSPSLSHHHTVCMLLRPWTKPLSLRLCVRLNLSLRRKYRCTDRSLLQYFHTSTEYVLCILLGVRLPTTTKNKQSINSPY